MDNTKLAWLAGIIDGEGSIGFYQVNRLDTPQGCVRTFILQLSNNDTKLISEARDIMRELTDNSVSVFITFDYRKGKRPHHIHYRIHVNSIAGLNVILTAIEPYLVAKKEQARILLDLFKTHEKYTPYSEEELKLIDALKDAKVKNQHYYNEDDDISRENALSFLAHDNQ